MKKKPTIVSVLMAASLLAVLIGWAVFGPGRSGRIRAVIEPESAAVYLEQGDLDAVRSRGTARFLQSRLAINFLPRCGFADDFERCLIDDFGETTGLDIVRIYVHQHEDLIPYLLSGKGDIIAANFAVTDHRSDKVDFSVPLLTVHEQVVVREEEKNIRTPADLEGRRVAVRRSSAYWQTLQRLQEEYPGIRIDVVDERTDTMAILSGVADGTYDVTIADENIVQAFRAYQRGIRPAFNLTGERQIAWAVRPDNPQLLEAINRFFERSPLVRGHEMIYRDDLPGIRRRGVLRVLTRNSAATYFIWRGQLMGFEYELAREFARQNDLRLEMVVVPRREDLLPWLRQGRGDLVAASLTANPERVETEQVLFSRPYHHVSEMLVVRTDDAIDDASNLAGRQVVVRKSSSYWFTLEKLRQQGIDLEPVPAPEDMETEEIIARVAAGEFDTTVADSHILGIELTWRDDIRGALTLGKPVSHAWAVRPGDRKLLTAVNAFFEEEYRGLFYNMTRNKYFRNEKDMQSHIEDRARHQGALSPYDPLIKKFAEEYNFDWRLIAAQMYEESRFDPEARSFAGATGLMQLLPRTARSLGLEDLTDPAASIEAGLKYMARLRRRFEAENLTVSDRMNFVLAAYNAGPGHVADARKLAEELGLDPNQWFDNVEKAMVLLSKPEYAQKARYGYARGRETVRYIRQIRHRYRGYLAAVADAAISSPLSDVAEVR